jgi:hypothetical protein
MLPTTAVFCQLCHVFPCCKGPAISQHNEAITCTKHLYNLAHADLAVMLLYGSLFGVHCSDRAALP